MLIQMVVDNISDSHFSSAVVINFFFCVFDDF